MKGHLISREFRQPPKRCPDMKLAAGLKPRPFKGQAVESFLALCRSDRPSDKP
jgi:hypothetical protein